MPPEHLVLQNRGKWERTLLLGKCMGNAGWKQQQTSNGLNYFKESGNYPARGRTQSTGTGFFDCNDSKQEAQELDLHLKK